MTNLTGLAKFESLSLISSEVLELFLLSSLGRLLISAAAKLLKILGVLGSIY